MQTLFRTLTCIALAVGPIATARAGLKPNSLFSHNAVLQRGVTLPVWGTARDGENITVEFAGQKVSTSARDGKWRVRLAPLKAGGPFIMTVTGDNVVTLTNILVGEVWVCSGQSNMEREIGPRPPQKPIDHWQEEVAAAAYPQIRQFRVSRRLSFQPLADADGAWAVCSPDTVQNFTAVGYFFGRDLHKSVKVPIGLLFSAWGGTVAEAWTSAGALLTRPDFKPTVERLQDAATVEQARKDYEQSLAGWYRTKDSGSAAEPTWADPALDTADWKEMNLPTSWEVAGLPNFDGVVWFRKELDLPESWTGKEAVLHLGAIDDQDTTWVNGVQVGAKGNYQEPRDYRIPASILKPGRSVIAVRVLDTGGPGGISAPADQMKLGSAAGVEPASIPLAGTWRYRAGAVLAGKPSLPTAVDNNPNLATVLYNGMIAPLQPFPIRGVIWYQGESNNDRPKQYRTLFPLLIADWRRNWGLGDFPFLFVQIAPYSSMTPELREAQFLTLQQSPSTAMAVITDAGDADDIHPSRKEPVGARLALAARALAYGQRLEYSGPLFTSMTVKGNRAILRFSHVGAGLVARGGSLKGFVIAGADKNFVPAQAEIRGKIVVVTSPQVTRPVAVRYGWSNVPDVNLFNKDGLPASPFRTDVD
jgi:sialate O-acetylesterase